MNSIEIQYSMQKLILILAGSLGFVIIGVFLVIFPDQTLFASNIVVVVGVIGIITFLFFTVIALKLIIKRRKNAIALTINNDGITDHLYFGLIPWSQITKINIEKVSSTKLITIYVENANQYLTHQSRWRRYLLKTNQKMYGTPLFLASSSLQCNFDELYKMINDRLQQYHAAV